MVLASIVAMPATVVLMTLDAKGDRAFIPAFRGKKLLAMVVAAYCIAVSRVLFQTVIGNRILTPAIMNLNAL